jgi:predicted RNA methylase
MTGATKNLYCGLDDFEDMGFLLHALRPSDLFIDIGANVGSFTVLAGAVVGASCIAIEPIFETYKKLLDNIAINRLNGRCEALNVAVGSEEGELEFTAGLDSYRLERWTCCYAEGNPRF